MILCLILLIYVGPGCVFESHSALLLTVPIFFPPVRDPGFDPLWFGILLVVATEIGLIAPPVGLDTFALSGVVGDVSAATIFRGETPFWIADIFCLAILAAFPGLAFYLTWQML